MSDYFDGYDAGLDAGWGAGKAKAYREVLHRLANPSHSAICGCQPCLVIPACRGEIDLARAMNSIFDIDEEDEPAEIAGVDCPLRQPPTAPYAPLGRSGGVNAANGLEISQIVATQAWAIPLRLSLDWPPFGGLMLTNDLVTQYLGECHLRGLARSTTEQYRWALTRLITHCPTPPRDGFDLLPVLGDNNLAPESRRDLLKCLRTFFSWCGRRYQLPNPCAGLEPIIRRRLLPRVLSRREVERLMAAALIERDRALLLVILDCGLRVGEVAGLMRNHIRDGWLVVDGKVGTRRVPVSDELCDTLMVLGDGEHIWTGKKGPLTRNGVVQVYQRMFQRAGIAGPKAGPHRLRHTFATWYLRAGGGVRQLQDILGHAKIETTMIYVHLAGRDVQADHSRYSPARTMGWLNG